MGISKKSTRFEKFVQRNSYHIVYVTTLNIVWLKYQTNVIHVVIHLDIVLKNFAALSKF